MIILNLNYSALLNFYREILIYENYILSIIEKLPHYDKNKELAYLREQVTALLSNECE